MERRTNRGPDFEDYGFVDKTQRPIGIKRREINSQFQFMGQNENTRQLPRNIEAYLFAGLTEPPRLVKKLRKEEPESFLAVKTLLGDEDFLNSKKVLVRENGFGFIPVLLALGQSSAHFLVSSWMVDRKEVMERNATLNLVESRIDFLTEGVLHPQRRNYDAAVLVHEQHQSPEILLYESAILLSPEECRSLYLITHKKKGGASLGEKISSHIGVDVSWTKKGFGGAMVIKFVKKHSVSVPEAPISSFVYEPQAGVLVRFKTFPSLFSAASVDVGTDFLIREILSEQTPQGEISIYDLACGYGAIGISLAVCLRKARVVMSDADARAVDIAGDNIQINDVSDRVSVQLADGTCGIKGDFDLVVSNPPLHTERRKLIEILTRANKLVKKGGKMLLVVEESRVAELREILAPYTGFIRERKKIPSHSVLEIKK